MNKATRLQSSHFQPLCITIWNDPKNDEPRNASSHCLTTVKGLSDGVRSCCQYQPAYHARGGYDEEWLLFWVAHCRKASAPLQSQGTLPKRECANKIRQTINCCVWIRMQTADALQTHCQESNIPPFLSANIIPVDIAISLALPSLFRFLPNGGAPLSYIKKCLLISFVNKN